MDKNIIDKIVDDTKGSLDDLNDALAIVKKANPTKKYSPLYNDGLIKRFENLFSKASNLLRLSLIQEGIQTVSPRQVLQESGRLNWITDLDFWLIALDARASTLNGTGDLTHNEYQNIASQFSIEVEVIINLISELRSDQ